MRSLVVLLASVAVACAASTPVVVSPYADQSRVDGRLSPAIGKEGLAGASYSYGIQGNAGRSHSVRKRSLGHNVHAAPALVAAPSAVSHQTRVDVISRPTAVLAHAAPVVAVAPAAVSHQSRVDVISSPAVVSHAVATPVSAHAAPVIAVAHGAVSHQARVDVRTSPTVVAHTAVTPITYAAAYYSGYNGNNGYNGYNGYNSYNGYNGYNGYNDYYNSAPLVQAW